MKKFFFNLIPIIICVAISIPVVLPYLYKGYFPSHDGEWAVVRLADMFRELKDAQFPPRYSGYLNFGYGYPLFNFAYPGPYYLAMIFKILRFGFVDSIKLVFALSVFVSSIGMYLLSQNIWKSRIAGIVSAVLYIYFPYRMIDLYVRGSIGESVALAIIPFVFLSFFKIVESQNTILWIAAGSISFAAFVLSHNIMTVLFLIPLGIFVLYLIFKKPQLILKLVSPFILGFLISSFFSVPALLEKGNIMLSKIPIADRALYFVKPYQLIFSSWGYGTPTDAKNPFTYQIGLSQIVVFFLVIFVLAYQYMKTRKKFKDQSSAAAIFFFITLGLTMLLFRFSEIFWKLPLLSEINYPWTILAPVGFLISLLSGFLTVQNIYLKSTSIVLSIISIILILPFARPQYFVNRGDNFYLTSEATTTSSNELMPLWVKKIPLQRPEKKIQIVQGKGEISQIGSNFKRVSFKTFFNQNSTVRINTIYYPGWSAFVDGEKTPILYKNSFGVMDIPVRAGQHTVLLKFAETPIRLLFDMISIVSLIFAAGIGMFGILQRNK